MRRRRRRTPLEAVGLGLVAGAAGTAALTAAQTVVYRLQGSEGSTAPGEVAKRVSEGVLQQPVPDDAMPALNNAAHFAYGTVWGAVYGAVQETAHTPALAHGPIFGLGAWAASLLHLPAMKLAPPVWKYSAAGVAQDAGMHLLYGMSVAGAYAGLDHLRR
jgi:hypothetical protein